MKGGKITMSFKSHLERLGHTGRKEYVKSMRLPISIGIFILSIFSVLIEINFNVKSISSNYLLVYFLVVIIVAPFIANIIANSIWKVSKRIFER
jgi:hypothetical protein